MNKIINQFRRIYADNGSGDRDFSVQEALLKIANEKVVKATEELIKASERLNDTAIAASSASHPLDFKTLN